MGMISVHYIHMYKHIIPIQVHDLYRNMIPIQALCPYTSTLDVPPAIMMH